MEGNWLRRWPLLRIATTVLALAGSTWPARVSADDMPRVRSSNALIRGLISDAVDASPTFRTVVDVIGATDGIVYVEEGLCRHGVHACLSLDVTPAAGYRFLRVIIELRDIASRRGRLEMIGTIAHELWHAVEVLAERGLRTTAAIYQFYARETPTSNRSFETQAAISIGAKVRREAGPRLNSVVNRGWRAQCAGPDNFFGEGWWAWPCV